MRTTRFCSFEDALDAYPHIPYPWIPTPQIAYHLDGDTLPPRKGHGTRDTLTPDGTWNQRYTREQINRHLWKHYLPRTTVAAVRRKCAFKKLIYWESGQRIPLTLPFLPPVFISMRRKWQYHAWVKHRQIEHPFSTTIPVSIIVQGHFFQFKGFYFCKTR